MEPLTLNEVRINPDVVGILQARARRARAQALHNGVLQLAAALRKRFASRGPLRLPFGARWG